MQHKLAFTFIGFALIPLLAVLQWAEIFIYKDQGVGKAEIASRLLNMQFAQEMKKKVRDLQTFSLTEILLEKSEENPEEFQRAIESYSNAILATHTEYKLAMLLDNNGIVRTVNTKDSKGDDLNTTNLVGKSFEQSSWFQAAIASKETIVETPKDLTFLKEIYHDYDLQVFPIVKSIKSTSGDVVGVCVVFVETSFVEEILKSVAESMNIPVKFGIYKPDGTSLAEYDSSNESIFEKFETIKKTIYVEGHDWNTKVNIKQNLLIDYLKLYLWPAAVFLGLIILYAFIAARRFVIPLQRLVDSAELMAVDKFSPTTNYQNRRDEYGRLARALFNMKKIRNSESVTEATDTLQEQAQETSQKIENTVQLISGLSAQTNMLALNASMEAVKVHHLDEVAEKANELAQTTSYNSQELLKKLSEIRLVCDDIQNKKSTK